MLWKIYTDSELNMNGHREYELLHGKDVLYSGYAKMDFFKKKVYEEDDLKRIWEIPEGTTEVGEWKKVIIVQHHSIKNSAELIFATFSQNIYFGLYLAKKYKDKISFIFKPHPNLRHKAVEVGMFESFASYDAYLKEWESLPNAKVVEEADNRDIYAASDEMIMDTILFLTEYMYKDKPLLFLRRKGQAFNNLGKEIL